MARPEREPQTELAKRLRQIRKILGDTERGHFAAQLNLPKNTLGNYEQGISEPPISLAGKYRDAFGINIAWLVCGEGEMFAQGQEKSITGNALLNKKVLFDAIAAVEERLEGRIVKPALKAKLIILAYEILFDDEKDKKKIDSIIALLDDFED